MDGGYPRTEHRDAFKDSPHAHADQLDSAAPKCRTKPLITLSHGAVVSITTMAAQGLLGCRWHLRKSDRPARIEMYTRQTAKSASTTPPAMPRAGCGGGSGIHPNRIATASTNTTPRNPAYISTGVRMTLPTMQTALDLAMLFR